eukprot:scaffold476_cov77-Skeletonema_marinoi.AAC.15
MGGQKPEQPEIEEAEKIPHTNYFALEQTSNLLPLLDVIVMKPRGIPVTTLLLSNFAIIS